MATSVEAYLAPALPLPPVQGRRWFVRLKEVAQVMTPVPPALPSRQGGGREGTGRVAYGQEEDRRRALAVGFDDHLTKPVRFDTLQRLLAEMAMAAKV